MAFQISLFTFGTTIKSQLSGLEYFLDKSLIQSLLDLTDCAAFTAFDRLLPILGPVITSVFSWGISNQKSESKLLFSSNSALSNSLQGTS